MKKIFAELGLVAFIGLLSLSVGANTRNITEYNLQSGVGLKGYDPVAVFPEGGGAPKEGRQQYQVSYEGVTYLFANKKNSELFEANPTKYEPTYGGYCAWAMYYGEKVDVKPDVYTMNGNRANYFASRFAKFRFDSNVEKHQAGADVNWRKFSGEEPRF
ncbi:MAG: YHS domain-containing (seleno)protein [Bacteriovoracia bacterium]